MITKLTSANRSLYMDLFARAEETLRNLSGGPGEVDIYDLDSFFQNFKELTQNDYSYLRLPLDEPCFEILDDEKHRRYIQVPDVFSKNGISVQGDDNAEILWFSIDRYYDNTDLVGPSKQDCERFNAMPMHIMIQWQTPFKKGVTPALVDKEGQAFRDENGKIYFGWPITKDITKDAGTIKFNVRFYQFSGVKDEDEKPVLSFGLNTQTATVKINEGIAYEITGQEKYPEGDLAVFEDGVEVITGKNDLIIGRIQNSSKFNYEGLEDASEPEYLINTDISSSLGKYSTEIELDDGTVVISETEYETLDLEDGKLLLQVMARPKEGAGVITYTSYASQNYGESVPGTIEILDSSEGAVFKKVIDVPEIANDVRVDGVRYFERNEEGVLVVVKSGLPNGGEAWQENNLDENGNCKYYVKLSSIYKIDEPGFYYIIARNSEGNKNPSSLKSNQIYVPAAKQLADADVEITNAEGFLGADGTITLEASVNVPEYNSTVNQWKQEGINIEGANGLSYSISVDEEDRKLYDETFTFASHTIRNNSETEDIEKSIRVTAEPTEFTFVHTNEEGTENVRTNVPEVSVIFSESDLAEPVDGEARQFNFVVDSIKYRWFERYITTEDIEAGEDIEANNKRVYPPLPREGEEDTTPWVELNIENNEVPVIKLDDSIAKLDGHYYCEIINCVNGHETEENKTFTEYITKSWS